MAIFHKDGKTYTLDHPNPLVKTQEKWDPSKLVFHNFHWDDIVARHDAPRARPKEQEIQEVLRPAEAEATPPEKDHFADVGKMVREESPADEAPETREPPEEDNREFDLPMLKYKVLSYCLPARREKRTDPLYGEVWDRVRYGDKFVFPSVVISHSDISLEFWTSDPREQITEGSIVYPYSYEVYNKDTESYDKVPYDEYRWWKVSGKEKKEEGWLLTAMPSDKQPDFSS